MKKEITISLSDVNKVVRAAVEAAKENQRRFYSGSSGFALLSDRTTIKIIDFTEADAIGIEVNVEAETSYADGYESVPGYAYSIIRGL